MSAATPPGGGTGDEVAQLTRAAELHRQGALSDAEFAAIKARLLGGGQPISPAPVVHKGPDQKQTVKGCLTIIGMLLVFGVLMNVIESVKLARLPESARTATIAARNATRTPVPTKTPGPTATEEPTPWPTLPPKPTKSSGVTMANFNRLETGMTYDQVVDILGEDGELQSESDIAGYKTSMYAWRGGFLSVVTVMFQNGGLTMKSQTGLR